MYAVYNCVCKVNVNVILLLVVLRLEHVGYNRHLRCCPVSNHLSNFAGKHPYGCFFQHPPSLPLGWFSSRLQTRALFCQLINSKS